MSKVQVESSEKINVAGQAITQVFSTQKTSPISLVCGQCNTRCFTEVNEIKPGCMGGKPHTRHNCSNCGAHLATVGQGQPMPTQACNIF